MLFPNFYKPKWLFYQLEISSHLGHIFLSGMSLFLNQTEIKFLFHSPPKMDLTQAIMFTKKTEELFHATGTVQSRQNRPSNWL